MLHFFRSTGYTVESLYEKWIQIAMKYSTVTRIAGRIVLLGDHSKVSKEGRRMPDVHTLHQDSQNAGKAKYIEGHNFGQVSAVITNSTISRSLPLFTEMQSSPPRKEGTKKPDGDTLVTQMVNLIHKTAKALGEPVIAALDAYFSSEAAWAAADKAISETGERWVEIVTRGQTNTVAYTIPEPSNEKKRGRPRIYGDRIKLYSLFDDMTGFTETTMILYGKKSKVRYKCLNLIWKPVKKLVRFVVVETDSGRCVLMSTDLTLRPEDIIAIYALRFKIESGFAEQKHGMGCFDYHFWTTALPKRKKWKKEQPAVKPEDMKRVDDAKRAINSFVCLGTIAIGIITIIAFSHNREIWKRYCGWMRTIRSDIPTVATVKAVLVQDFPVYLQLYAHLTLCVIVLSRQRVEHFLFGDAA